MYKLIHRSMRVYTNPYRIPFPLKLKKNVSVAIPKKRKSNIAGVSCSPVLCSITLIPTTVLTRASGLDAQKLEI